MSTRPERVGELIRTEVSRIIRADVNDPRIGFVSLTEVEVSPDLINANIKVSILGSEEVKIASMKGLTSATSFIRGKLGDILELRSVPEIRFVRDDSLEKGSKVLGLMSKLGEQNGKTGRRNKKSSSKR